MPSSDFFLIDSHAHLTSFEDEEIDPLLSRAKEARIKAVINVCTDPISLEKGMLLSKKYPWIFHAAATTPHDVEKDGKKHFSTFQNAAEMKTIVAIGETGLDYYYKHSDKEVQKEFLIKYFRLALLHNLPLIIHCREAFEDLFKLSDDEYIQEQKYGKAVLHCFTGTEDDAKEALKRGWYISFSGIVTFKNSVALCEVAKKVPLERLLIETDAPYLAPLSKRGKKNEPSFLPETAEVLAKIKGIDLAKLSRATTENAIALFSLPDLAKKRDNPN